MIKYNISVSKKSKYLYFLQTKSTTKKLKHRFTWNNCLFGFVKLTKNINPEKDTGYSTGFDLRSEFSLPDGRIGFIIFGADMSSSVHIDN